MNQILYTGGKNKRSSMTDTQKIVIFFAVIIIIFAICAIGLGTNLLSKVKSENVGQAGNGTNTTPSGQDNTEYIQITFGSELGGVKVNAQSLTNVKIESITYWWEGDEKTTTQISDTQYETVIPSKQGTHYLYVEAIDENGNKKEAQQLVIGDSGPEVTILTDGVSNYVIRINDDEEISKVVITLNSETQEIEVNNQEFEYMVAIPQGDSLIEVTAYNSNGLSTNKKAKVTNFGG